MKKREDFIVFFRKVWKLWLLFWKIYCLYRVLIIFDWFLMLIKILVFGNIVFNLFVISLLLIFFWNGFFVSFLRLIRIGLVLVFSWLILCFIVIVLKFLMGVVIIFFNRNLVFLKKKKLLEIILCLNIICCKKVVVVFG